MCHTTVQEKFLKGLLIVGAHSGDESDYCPSNQGFLVILEPQDKFACVSIMVLHKLEGSEVSLQIGIDGDSCLPSLSD